MAKVMEMVALTLMPMSWAAPLSSDTARMALPILVLLVNSVRPTMMTTHDDNGDSSASPVMVSCAADKRLDAQLMTGGEALGVGAPDQQRRVLQEVADADGGDQHGQRRALRAAACRPAAR